MFGRCSLAVHACIDAFFGEVLADVEGHAVQHFGVFAPVRPVPRFFAFFGHDYFLQVTDARPDTGGLSGATPGEAVSWGKVDPDRLPDAVVCYLDSTVALPIMTAYALAQRKPRKPRRLYERREEFMKLLTSEYQKSRRR